MKELQALSRPQLLKELSSLREKVRDLRFRIHSQEIKNNHQLSAVKKDIARIMTILNEGNK